jgi:hypothetical protein
MDAVGSTIRPSDPMQNASGVLFRGGVRAASDSSSSVITNSHEQEDTTNKYKGFQTNASNLSHRRRTFKMVTNIATNKTLETKSRQNERNQAADPYETREQLKTGNRTRHQVVITKPNRQTKKTNMHHDKPPEGISDILPQGSI